MVGRCLEEGRFYFQSPQQSLVGFFVLGVGVPSCAVEHDVLHLCCEIHGCGHHICFEIGLGNVHVVNSTVVLRAPYFNPISCLQGLRTP